MFKKRGKKIKPKTKEEKLRRGTMSPSPEPWLGWFLTPCSVLWNPSSSGAGPGWAGSAQPKTPPCCRGTPALLQGCKNHHTSTCTRLSSRPLAFLESSRWEIILEIVPNSSRIPLGIISSHQLFLSFNYWKAAVCPLPPKIQPALTTLIETNSDWYQKHIKCVWSMKAEIKIRFEASKNHGP